MITLPELLFCGMWWYFDSEMPNNQRRELANKIDGGDVYRAEEIHAGQHI